MAVHSLAQAAGTRPAALSCPSSHLCAPRLPVAPISSRRSLSRSQPSQRTAGVQTSALPQHVPAELLELAGKETLIGGTATVTFAMVLLGLALGFVLLRVEALVEEGKIKF